MFSGLGSIADLNQSFVQFTSNLTNLDTLQPENATEIANPPTLSTDQKSTKQTEVTTDQLTELRVMYESAVESLTVANDEIHSQKLTITSLERELEMLRRQLDTNASAYDELKTKIEDRSNQEMARDEDEGSSAVIVAEDKTDSGQLPVFDEVLEKELTDLRKRLADSELENASLRSELFGLRSVLSSSEDELQGVRDNMSTETRRLEAVISEHNTSLLSLNQEKEELQGQLSNLQKKLVESESQVQSICQSASEIGAQAQSAESTIESLQSALAQAQQSGAEAELKVATLTDKLKDMMHRYADLKTKGAAQLQQADEKYADLLKLAQAKDSEIVALKLKNENADRAAGDLRLKAAELAERYSEAQRELARLKEGLEASGLHVSGVANERDRLQVEVRRLVEQRDSLAAEHAAAAERCTSLQAEYEQQLRAMVEERAVERRAHEDQLSQAQAELVLAVNRMKQDADSAGNLEQYKKKAQLALKKANATIAELTEEAQRLRAVAEEASSQLQEVLGAARAAEEQLREAQTKLSQAEGARDEAVAAVDALSAEETSAQQAYAEEVAALKRELDELRAECEQLRATRDSGGDHGRSRKGTSEFKEPGFVSVKVPPRQQPTRLEEDSSSAASAESEPFVPAAPATLPPHAAPASAGVGTGTLGAAQLGGSSWAMVASASATSSGLSTAHHSGQNLDAAVRQHAPAAADSEETAHYAAVEDMPAFQSALSTDSLIFINQLQHQLDSTKKALAQRGIDLEAAHQLLQHERDEKRGLQSRVEELRAYLDRLKQQEGPDSATNMEYLKNCVFKFMSSTDLSEKQRLYPVIATILKLTSQEMKAVEAAFQQAAAHDSELQSALSTIGSFASTSLGSFWDVLGGSDPSAGRRP